MMKIEFYSENDFNLQDEDRFRDWLERVARSEDRSIGEISFVFCDDDYLLEINQKFLQHDTYTDIITFDNSVGKILNADIYISTDRVIENADLYEVKFVEELRRVMVHGVLHLCGYKDRTSEEKREMRTMEDEKIKMFHVEQNQ